MPSPFEAVSAYFHAKDGNRPFLMRHAFAEDIALEMVVKTDAISFPSSAKGLPEIEQTLCRRFANDFENVYTFCLARPQTPIDAIFHAIGSSACRRRTTEISELVAVVTTGTFRMSTVLSKG